MLSLDFGLVLLNLLFLPLDWSYLITPAIFFFFLNLLLVFQGPSRNVHALIYSGVLMSFHFQCWTKLTHDILGTSFMCYMFFVLLDVIIAASMWLLVVVIVVVVVVVVVVIVVITVVVCCCYNK